MNEMERAQYITRNFQALQGLKLLPFGLFMLLMSTRDLGWPWLGEAGDCTYTLPMFLVCIILYMVIDRYYKRRFGSVQQKDASTQWLLGIAMMGAFFGLLIFEVAVKPPFSLIFLLISALLIYAGIRTQRWYYWAIGVVLIALNLLPVILSLTREDLISGMFGFWWNFALGLGWCVIGLLDHIRLVRGMNLLGEGAHARAE